MPQISAFWPGLLDDHPESHDGKPPMRTLILTLALAIALAVGLPGKAAATFIGPYDVANWTTTLTGNPAGGGPEAFVSTSGAPNSVILFGGNAVRKPVLRPVYRVFHHSCCQRRTGDL